MLVLGALIIALGLVGALRDHRRGKVATWSWSVVVLGAGFVSLALAHDRSPTIAVSSLTVGLILLILAERTATREARRARSLLDEAQREATTLPDNRRR
jgi:hypothetical protein